MANQSQHAGTIADPIPQRLLYKKGDKVYTVATGPSTSGPTTDVVEATDTRKGITRLSDAIDSNSDAATGVTAATPLAVKYVNDKVTAVEEKNAEQDKKLESVDKTLTDQGGRLDALEAGGSGGGGMSYVVTPKILTPTNDAVGQNTKITIIGSGYENVFPTDARKHRIFELSKVPDFGTKLETKEADADSIKFDTQLDSQTKYYARIKDVSQKEYRSNWSSVVEFTTGDVTHANTPVITLKGYADSPTDIGSGLTIEGGAYSVNDSSSDTHKASSWSIRLKSGRANVWESLNDTTNKTSIEVPKGTLQKTTAYVVTVIYHSTNFNDSSPAEQEFTTSNDFGTVQAPVITISGEPNKILETPSFRGGVFSCTRDPDTHESTEIQVIKSQDQSTVWTHTANGATTSLTIPKGLLTVSTQYKVKMRYKGAAYGWSEWAEKDFTTAAEFTRYLYIGVPGTSTFGVGLATQEVLDSFDRSLEKLPNTDNSSDFQYGLYHWHGVGSEVYVKCVPKFYIAYLQKTDNGANLNDSELDALLPYVEVTKEQMKEAQRRSPYNAIVIAPADAFADRNEAQQHGFILPRGFIDGGKEKPCVFISNTLSLYYAGKYSHGIDDPHYSYNPYRFVRLNKSIGGATFNYEYADGAIDRIRNDVGDNFSLGSAFAWAALCLITLTQAQYTTSTVECAWYDSTLQHNYPKGINNMNVDVDDASVTSKAYMSVETDADIFVDQSVYAKTTHNGSINGITHVNGWLTQTLIGLYTNSNGLQSDELEIYSLKETERLRDFVSSDWNNTNKYDKCWKQVDHSRSFNLKMGNHNYSTLSRDFSGADWALNFIHDREFTGLSSDGTNEFGCDHYYLYPNSSVQVGGDYELGKIGGIYAKHLGYLHSSTVAYRFGVRVMAYPNDMVTVTATADYEGAEPKKQTIKVPSGTSDTDAKSQLAVPVSEKYRFTEWQKA